MDLYILCVLLACDGRYNNTRDVRGMRLSDWLNSQRAKRSRSSPSSW